MPWGIVERISNKTLGPPVEAAMTTSLLASAINYFTPATLFTISITRSGSKGLMM